MKIKGKVVLLFATLFTIGTLAMTIFSSYTMEKEITTAATEKLKSDLAFGRTLFDEKYLGSWSVKGDQLYKGATLINGNYEIVDRIGKLTGNTATVFLQDTRVATNVISGDQRAVGTKISEAVADIVLKKGETYIGEADVLGTRYLAAYEPILDEKGQIIGIWYVGVPYSTYDTIIAHFNQNLYLFGAVGMLVAVAFLYFLIGYYVRPLLRVTQTARHVAAGDLSVEEVRAGSKDEIGQLATAVNDMVANLRGLIGQVGDTAAQVAAASEELSANTDQATRATEQITLTIQDVATGAEQQLNGATESAAAIHQMATSLQRISGTTEDVAAASRATADEAEQGTDSIRRAEGQMGQISAVVRETADDVLRLESRSQEIDQIVGVITGIAEQTNLLALNAAIEAARAGEQGRGFAVVADEVRKLAEQSGASAGQIAELIRLIQSDTNRAVAAMGQVTREVESGTEIVHEAGRAFENIVTSARTVAARIEQVNLASAEIASTSDTVSDTVEQVTRIAQDSSDSAQSVAAASEQQLASVQEIAASAVSLSEMAQELQEMVGKFKV
ncbi:methyl-accepting chemotaxis protein [Tumebacillus sp. DT12]|uniref:Methyl-accepting chemotaxis protein n=1 Tax=Tumebacillus lacus TaxID=2995335 RepID=A0ABT3X2L5_9BACL|nr:methyl-accepting chemotaxis protein [Tumebacillus lacus]MCX7570022.1 methyl-accepting chemotaxis protein [Tumebacillus lacus]